MTNYKGKISPCKGCNLRRIGCHDWCEFYKKWKDDNKHERYQEINVYQKVRNTMYLNHKNRNKLRGNGNHGN